MKRVDPFFAQIVATPDDESLRLIYADWLDDRDDPRGELIRLWAEMAALAPHSEAYAQKKVRRNELFAQIDPKWRKALGYVPTHRPLFHKLPAHRAERWRLVEEFIEVWHGPLKPKDGFTAKELDSAEARLGVRLPIALREWLALAGKRKDIWSIQDVLLGPDRLRINDDSGMLEIRWENQGCELWGIRLEDLGEEDPPVYETYERNESSPTVTAFAIQILMCEVKCSSKVRWHIVEGLTRKMIQRDIEQKYSPCDLPERYWLSSPMRFFEGKDLIVETQGNLSDVYITTRSDLGIAQLSKTIRERLDEL